MRQYVIIEGTPSERQALLLRRKLSQNSHRDPRNRSDIELGLLLKIAGFLILAGIGICAIIISSSISGIRGGGKVLEETFEEIPECAAEPCFFPHPVRVPSNKPGFPSFWDYGHRGPLEVSYDKRALKINGERAFFLGGSMHPARATKATWEKALDEAVHIGLNLITIYVMWSAHQPLPHEKLNWGFPGSYGVECEEEDLSRGTCGWNLAEAIRLAADRGLFVHLRVGPYDCAEYNYGGIPEWLPLHRPRMVMRRPNREWLEVMTGFVTKLVKYVTREQLWAYQGGNIIMAQIENELGDDESTDNDENLLLVDESGNFVDPGRSSRRNKSLRNATLQDYANWCGDLAEKLAPNVTWTMCNGLFANNTILTCNAVSDGHLWLENNGGNGRIQVDQPAIFTEFEGGFQTWGSVAENPLDYFWGRTARAMARDALKWFARGGCHLNYYMFWGSYNRQRMAGAGITNIYASDVPLCPSGERRQPKFGHFEALHHVITTIAPTLLLADSSLGKGEVLNYLSGDGSWKQGTEQRVFRYNVNRPNHPSILFLENDAKKETVIQVLLKENDSNPLIVMMNAESSIIMIDGKVEFDSSSIEPISMSVDRRFEERESLPLLFKWSSWGEPIGSSSRDPLTWSMNSPVEQTRLNLDSGVASDYAWYETWFEIDERSVSSTLFMDTQRANGLLIFVDDQFVGSADDHLHKEGPITLSVPIGELREGEHTLCILSESLGYHNLIGRWGGSTKEKVKGLTGDVILSLKSQNISLTDGREWRSYPGLHGEARHWEEMSRKTLKHLPAPPATGPTWSTFQFETPRFDPSFQSIFLKMTHGRGHFWLNGNDMGRFWNITRGHTRVYSQERYFMPVDFLYSDGRLNEVVIFNAFGESRGYVDLEMSWITATDTPSFEDTVDFKNSCI